MNYLQNTDPDSGLILAAEECPPEQFNAYHKFSARDEMIIRELTHTDQSCYAGGAEVARVPC